MAGFQISEPWELPCPNDSIPAEYSIMSNARTISEIEWLAHKDEIQLLYLTKQKTKEEVMRFIEKKYGLQASEYKWGRKLDEWGFKKNSTNAHWKLIARMLQKRKLEGKESDTYLDGKLVPRKKVTKEVSRHTLPSWQAMSIAARSPSPLAGIEILTPPQEPSLFIQFSKDVPSEVFEEPTINYPPRLMASNKSETHSTCASTHEGDSLNSPETNFLSASRAKLTDANQPWSQYDLHHPIDDHVDILLAQIQRFSEPSEGIKQAEHATQFGEVGASVNSSGEQTTPLDTRYIGSWIIVKHPLEIETEEGHGIVGQTTVHDMSGLAEQLAISHIEHGEFAPPTMMTEFELAKCFEGMGQYEQAEYHCRRILDIHPQLEVEVFYGTLLANTSRAEEAMYWMFRSLSRLIIYFIDTSPIINGSRFILIEALFHKLIGPRNQEDPVRALLDRWCLLTTTFWDAFSVRKTHEAIPQLFIHGFGLAQECLALGLAGSNQHLYNSAGWMYRELLEHATAHLDLVEHANEIARAHREYSRFLRKERLWMASSKELLLACESEFQSCMRDRELVTLLEKDSDKLGPHLIAESPKGEHLKENMQQALLRIQSQSPILLECIPESSQRSPLEEYLLSTDLPILLATFESSATSISSRFKLPSRVTSLSQKSHDKTSTTSIIASSSYMSHPYGMSFSRSENYGVKMVL